MLYSPMSRIPLLSPFAKDPSPEEASIDSTELAIVVASKQDSNTEWMDQLTRKSSWNPYIYNVDAVDENATLRIPAQKGHEAMVYLTFIIDRWDDLPKYTTFIHGHETAWHQESDVFDLLTNIRLNVLDSVGYIPLRCDWYPSCPAEIRPITHDAIVWGTGLWRSDTEWGITGVWPLFFPDAPLPETIAAPCCAQFVVTRDAIRSRSKETYITMRNWILSTHIVDNVTGRVMEKLWAYIFTDEAVQYVYFYFLL